MDRIQQFATQVKETVTDLWQSWTGSPKKEAARVPAQVPDQMTPAAPTVPQNTEPAAPAANNPSLPVQQPPANVSAPVQTQAADQIRDVREKIKDEKTFAVKTEGRKSTAPLKSKVGVARIDWAKLNIKAIPLVDVGVEPEISRKDLSIPDWNWKLKSFEAFQKLSSPNAVSSDPQLLAPVIKVGPVKYGESDKKALDARVTKEKVDRIDYKIVESQEVNLKPFEEMTEDQVKMLVMRILFDKGNKCHVVIGFGDDLSRKPEYHIEANYAVGACAKEFKLHQVAMNRLSDVIKKFDPTLSPQAFAVLGQNLPPSYEQEFYELFKLVENKPEYFKEKRALNEIYYRAAKGAFKSGHYKTAERLAANVESSNSAFGTSAQFVIGLSQFQNKERPQALATFEALAERVKGTSDTLLHGLVYANLGRMEFTNKKYDASLNAYLEVPKDHPLWVSALIEQGWAQLALNDSAGAIGNMYSLHSPYFRVLYQPQSFVIRTIGYLNICQYGDAYRTLTKLEGDYREWLNKLNAYLSKERTSAMAYETTKTYLRSKSTTEIDGLPYQVVREAARGKEFLTIQNAINDRADELGLFAGVIVKLNKDRENVKLRAEQAKKRADGYVLRIAKAHSLNAPAGEIEKLQKNYELEKSRSVPNQYELAILEQSQKAFQKFELSSREEIANQQSKLAKHAGAVLLARFKAMQSEVAKTLDNNEFLRYEIFAGSGENIRYQIAGGATGSENRLPATVKPQKMMNWSFDGEFWEDEIGNYRSSLKNNCPKTAGTN